VSRSGILVDMTKKLTIAGLLVGAVGIVLLWAGGIDFPFLPPPGVLFLSAGALFVSFVRLRWAPALGAALGLFIVVGFFASPTGIDNLTGEHGSTVVVGTIIQLLGLVTAVIAGTAATARAYRRPSVAAGRND
jgi:hypothetical protein